jgi:hypothetical protein
MSQPSPEQPFLPAQEEVEAIEKKREKQREEERGGAPGGVMPPFAAGSKVVLIGGPKMAVAKEVGSDGVSRIKWKERFILFFIDSDGAFRSGISKVRVVCSSLYNGVRRIDARVAKAIRRAPRTMVILALLGGGWISAAWMRPAPVIIVQPPKEEPGFFQRLLDSIPKTREVTK